MQRAHDLLYEINPLTGLSIEVFYSDRTLETFGRAALVGFGGLVGEGSHRMVQRPVRLLRATQRIATR